MLTFWDWIQITFVALFLIFGTFLAFGWLQVSKAVPKKHILNRAMGANVLLLGIGFGLLFFPWGEDARYEKWILPLFGLLLMFIGAMLTTKTNTELHRYAREMREDN